MLFVTVTVVELRLSYTTEKLIFGFTAYLWFIGLPETVEDAREMTSGSPNIFRKIHEGARLNSQRFGSGNKKIDLGVILPPKWSLDG